MKLQNSHTECSAKLEPTLVEKKLIKRELQGTIFPDNGYDQQNCHQSCSPSLHGCPQPVCFSHEDVNFLDPMDLCVQFSNEQSNTE